MARILGRHARQSRNTNKDESRRPNSKRLSTTPSSSPRNKFRSQSSTLSDDPSCVSSVADSVGGGDTKVYVDDAELYARAREITAKLDFAALTNLSLSNWTWKESRKEFTLYEAACGGEIERQQQPEVLVAGDINCSIEEVIAVLRSLNEADLNASMKALYKRDFIYGSLVHTVPLSPQQQQQDGDQLGDEEELASPSSTNAAADNFIAVKTGTFVRSNLFARNEEWCFLEAFERSPSGDSLVIAQSSIPACELRSGKALHSRVDQLNDVTTAFLVERIPRTRSVRLVFHGKFDGSNNMNHRAKSFNKGTAASSKMASARLMILAKGVSRIPDIVRRRRLGVQKFADQTVFAAASNSRCICCTKNLRMLKLLKKKQRCSLCAYNVCDRCCSQEKMETLNGHTASILVCMRCMECVNSCEYADISTCGGRRSIRVELDSVESDPKKGSNINQRRQAALVGVFENALADPDKSNQAAAKVVIRHIVSQRELNAKKPGTVVDGQSSTTNEGNIRDLKSKTDHIVALEKTLGLQAACPSLLNECVLANAESRNYLIHVPENPATTVPDYPMPKNEAQRLHAIHTHDFANIGEVMELNIICSLAAETLQCPISMITVVDKEHEFILSCNADFLHRTSMPRNQTFCSHLIMDSKPLLIRNPDADVRFHNMDAVAKNGVRFYCGFPVVARDGTVVGSVCCLDFEQRSLTQSQYATMQTLAKTASKVIQIKADAMRSCSIVKP